MLVLAHLSDIHLPPLPRPNPAELVSKRGLGYMNWLRRRSRLHRREILDALVADIKAQQPGHIAVTGDLVNLSLSNEFGPGRAWLEGLGDPQHVSFVPGNHDVYVGNAVGQAERHWGDYMRGDAGDASSEDAPAGFVFPYVRRRGDVALVGVSTGLPTYPLAATGTVGAAQMAALAQKLEALGREGLFRVVLIHHPPIPGDNWLRRLTDAAAVREVLRKSGAELVLHGHHHESCLVWLAGPRFAIPCIGVPAASGALGESDEPGAYNLYEIDNGSGAWRCTMTARGFSNETGQIEVLNRIELAA
jgi:3',5'-cyclic AMP phosphodiesterase CpdA